MATDEDKNEELILLIKGGGRRRGEPAGPRNWHVVDLEAGSLSVSEALGHSSVSITLGLYSHVLPNMQDELAGAVAKWLACASGELSRRS